MADPNEKAPDAPVEEEDKDASLTLKGGMAVPSLGWAKGGQTFLTDVRGEFQKISWPTRRQVMIETGVVLVVVTLLTLLVLALDWIFSQISNRVLV